METPFRSLEMQICWLLWWETIVGEPSLAGEPSGPGNKLYFDPPIVDKMWECPFANGMWALKRPIIWFVANVIIPSYLQTGQEFVIYPIQEGYNSQTVKGFLLPQVQLVIKAYNYLTREKQSIDTSLAG